MCRECFLDVVHLYSLRGVPGLPEQPVDKHLHLVKSIVGNSRENIPGAECPKLLGTFNDNASVKYTKFVNIV